MIVDVGTRYIIEVREPHIGEWVMLPGPIFTMIVDPHTDLRQQACSVVIGTLAIGMNDAGDLAYDVRPMPDMAAGGQVAPSWRPQGQFPT